jgi:hypothetical protein
MYFVVKNMTKEVHGFFLGEKWFGIWVFRIQKLES